MESVEASAEPLFANANGPQGTSFDRIHAPVSHAVVEPTGREVADAAQCYKRVLSRAIAPIAGSLQSFEELLRSELRSNHASVSELLAYVADLGGKRLRPSLLLLTAQACGDVNVEAIRLAAVVEMVHTATLVHDDILDQATLRRHKLTLHHRWDVPASILTGDWLFTRAYGLANQGESTIPGRWIAAAAQQVCEGEILQDFNARNLALREEEYLAILGSKTGSLCGVSCALGAWSTGAEPSTCKRYEDFGMKLGIAFQVFDDWLDIWGDESKAGKTLGTDIHELKPTLPVIRTLNCMAPTRRDKLVAALLANSSDAIKMLRENIEHTDASEYTQKIAKRYIDEALALLSTEPASEALNSLRCLATSSITRGA